MTQQTGDGALGTAMAKNDNLINSRVSHDAKSALHQEAAADGVSLSMRVRQFLTTVLRERGWVIEDPEVPE